ncbi:D-amino-acid transaminase [Ornithinibacillus halophilus]|uniref:D-alanine aminotransferase n=1 Tax=Ornithinibacillus halophilus TaxID=930117 RepID=A0A1M5LY95_9BACI|nr:D-amino-acid transaminase [Ornithinibacillus halophilus]SHG69991.1 D-alanine transaminase [Ornithinibacillus halophilus]
MSVYPIVLSQSKFIHRDSVKFPMQERALQFGDGIYEVIRIYNGDYYLLNEHIERLFRSAEAIKIQINLTKEALEEFLTLLLERNNIQEDGKLYLQISRGSAPRDHLFPTDVEPNFYAYIQNLPRNLEALKNGISTITHRDERWENCYIKSLNLLPNVLAKQEAKEQGRDEAILHRDGIVTECTAANVYLVKNNKIYTHPTTNRILNGCVRMRIEEFTKKLSLPFIEEAFTIEDIIDADEIFLSSSTAEITPITCVDEHKINNGQPGPITIKLQQAYEIDANIHQNSQQFA